MSTFGFLYVTVLRLIAGVGPAAVVVVVVECIKQSFVWATFSFAVLAVVVPPKDAEQCSSL